MLYQDRWNALPLLESLDLEVPTASEVTHATWPPLSFSPASPMQTGCWAQLSCDLWLFSPHQAEFSHTRHHSELPQKLDYTHTEYKSNFHNKTNKDLRHSTWPKIPMSQKPFHVKQKLERKGKKPQPSFWWKQYVTEVVSAWLTLHVRMCSLKDHHFKNRRYLPWIGQPLFTTRRKHCMAQMLLQIRNQMSKEGTSQGWLRRGITQRYWKSHAPELTLSWVNPDQKTQPLTGYTTVLGMAQTLVTHLLRRWPKFRLFY